MATEQKPVSLVAQSATEYGWQITGLSNPFNTTYYTKAAIFDRSFTDGQTTEPIGMISQRAATATNPNNSTPVEKVTGLNAGATYTVYGGLLTPSGAWWRTTPISSSVTLPQINEQPVNIATVIWQTPQHPMAKPYGQRYISNDTAKNQWGRLNASGVRDHLWGFYYSQTSEPNQLIWEMYDELQKNLNPIVKYTVQIVDLKRMTGQNFETLRIGDTVTCIDKELGVSVQARVLEKNVDLNVLEKSTVVIGQANEIVAVSQTLAGSVVSQPPSVQQQVMDTSLLLKRGDPIHSDWLEGQINALRNQINAGGGSVRITEDQGILIIDPNNAGHALKLEGGIFALSKELLPNGDYNWRTFGTGTGIVADEITGGTISGVTISGVTITGGTITGTNIKATDTLDIGDFSTTTAKTIRFSGAATIYRPAGITEQITISAERTSIGGGDIFLTSNVEISGTTFVEAYLAANQTINNGNFILQNWTQATDRRNEFDPVTGEFRPNYNGVYLMQYFLRFTSYGTTTPTIYIDIYKNGAEYQRLWQRTESNPANINVSVMGIINAASGDIYKCGIYCNTSLTIEGTGSVESGLKIIKIA